MKREPDYGTYSLAELEDARRHIDASAHPERAARLAAEISSREEERKQRDRREARSERARVLSRKAIGIFLTVAGVITSARMLDALPGGPSSALLIFLVVTIYGMLIVAGVLLILRRRGALWFALVLMVAYLPIVQGWRLRYLVTFFPTAEFKLWPEFGIAVSTSQRFDLRWFASEQPLYIGINLTAAVILSFLWWHLERAQRARERLGRRGEDAAPPAGE